MKNNSMNKNKTKQILATVVMGMNLVNATAPLAVLAAAEQAVPPMPSVPRSEEKPLEYAVLPQLLDIVDKAVFGQAEAADYDGNGSFESMGSGDTQRITAGQKGSVTTMSGGYNSCAQQHISNGGKGTVNNMEGGGEQHISAGGQGTIDTMSGLYCYQYISGGEGTVNKLLTGGQVIYAGGIGTVTVLEGVQHVSAGGVGSAVTVNGAARQDIYSGGKGTIDVLNGYGQNIASGGIGTIKTMDTEGTQWISFGAIGSVVTLKNGTQLVASGGTGTIDTLASHDASGGQVIYSNAIGTIKNMIGGQQHVFSDGVGKVTAMSGGSQFISKGGQGTIDTMSGLYCYQYISGGEGTVNKLLTGGQVIYAGGIGTVTVLEGVQHVSAGGVGSAVTVNGAARQDIYSGGKGTIDVLNGYGQNIASGGIGTIKTMDTEGTQWISFGAIGSVVTLKNGTQLVASGGTGTIDTLASHDASGGQVIYSNAIGTIKNMIGGQQHVFSDGVGKVTAMSGGSQFISKGGHGTIGSMTGSGYQEIHSTAVGSVGTLNQGTQMVCKGGTGTVGSMTGGGYQEIHSTAVGLVGTLNQGTQMVCKGGTGTVGSMTGGSQVVLSGGTSLATTVAGGELDVKSGAIVSGVTVSAGTIGFESLAGASFTLSGTTKAVGGRIDMAQSGMSRSYTPAYETLTIDKLSGSGTTFVLDTDLAGGANSDKIVVSAAEQGTHYVQIKDISLINKIEVTGAHQQLLITDNSGKLTFEGKELNNGGLFDVTPSVEQIGNDWYLTKLAKTVNKDTKVLLEGGDGNYALWRNTSDNLRKHLGDLHNYRNAETEANGIWSRYIGGKFGSGNFDGSYNMYQLGYDKVCNAKSIYGFAVENGSGNSNYSFGSGKDKLFAGSLYGTWYSDSNSYTDVVARFGQFDTDLKSYGDYPDKASYKSRAYSLSVEYGKIIELNKKAGTFIEPQAQFIMGHLGSSSYTTDRGSNVYAGEVNSYIGRLGVVLGQKNSAGNDIYLKASALHEFGGSRDIYMQAANGEVMGLSKDYGDTWFELGLGGNVRVGKASVIYGDIEHSFGGDINKKWQINAGVRFEF